MFKHQLITGRPGVGKTTFIKNFIPAIKRLRPNWTINGFWTREVRRQGQRIGFNINTLDGQDGVLARVDFNLKSKLQVGKYIVDIADLEAIGVPVLYRNADLVIIDELGKMELFSLKFKQAVKYALNNQPRVVATIPYYEIPFLMSIKRRSDVQIRELTRLNKAKLFNKIMSCVLNQS